MTTMQLPSPLLAAVAAALACAAALPAGGAVAARDVTFSRDVAPILQDRCQGCHRPGQIGPMPLLTYDDARPWAKAIAKEVAARKMPPWFAHPDSRPMKGDLNLSPEEIDTILAWVDRGAPEGDRADLPPPRELATYAGGWVHRRPDLVLRPAEAFLVGEEVDDEYRCYHVKLGLENDVWVKGVEFQAGNPAVVHHFILFQDTAGVGARLDAAAPEPGWECGQMDSALATAKILEMWAPGNLAPLDPPGIALRLDRGKDLILQIHYHGTTGADAEDWSRFAIHLAQPSETIMKEMRGQLVSAWTLDIPAGDPSAEHRATWTAPKDITVYTAGGHMHYRGKDIGMWATKPGGERETLLWMPAYDFNWQLTYAFVEPYRAPAGTVFEMISHHDNSADNPHNPAIPPVDVKWGLATSDEMAFTGFGYTLDDEALGVTPWVPQPPAGEATGGR
ncbi:MAG TPA: thiol-disulfide isomerase [Thermoanaerobaculia bacterium]|nr:thiol-disulfide isomerase [Thermoanaerobaculia bacterium]